MPRTLIVVELDGNWSEEAKESALQQWKDEPHEFCDFLSIDPSQFKVVDWLETKDE